MGEYGVLPAFQDFGDKGRRKVFKGGDLHRSNLREQHIIIHGIHAVAIFTCLADSKAAAGRECVGNQVHLGAEGIPQSGDYIVPKSGEAAQSGCFYIRKFQDPGVDSQVVRQMGQHQLVHFWFGADEKFQTVLTVLYRAYVIDGFEGAAECLAGFKAMTDRNVNHPPVCVEQFPGRIGEAPFLDIAAHAFAQQG